MIDQKSFYEKQSGKATFKTVASSTWTTANTIFVRRKFQKSTIEHRMDVVRNVL